MEEFHCKNYAIERAIGKRHRGRAYKARRVSDGAVCAIKELNVSHMTEEEKEDLTEEIRVLATVHNENLIRYYDVFKEEKQMFVVTEYCEEADLRRHMQARTEQQKFFSESQIWSFLIQMLRGLVALHSKGLIHRNVRATNIIQLDGSAVKLGDVGVGKLKEGTAATQIGDPHYIPPEVWENKAYTFKGDVWAVGCVLYEMITLALPFGGCSLPELRRKVIEGSYQPIPSSFSSGLTKVLKLLFNPDEAMRISAQDMLAHAILQGHVQHAPAPAPILRVQVSEKDHKVENFQVNPSILMQAHGSLRAEVTGSDEQHQSVHTSKLDQKQAGPTSPPSKTPQGVLDAKPAASSARSKVLSVLAPRAILSSPDNDRMLSRMDVRRNRQAATKGKGPRVAMLAKVVVPKPPSEKASSVTPPPSQDITESSAPLSRVNIRHFKTAYIQNPTAVSDESVPELEALSTPPLPPPPPPPLSKSLPKKKKSSDSARSSVAGSCHSDETTSMRVRAPFDKEDAAHVPSAPPSREESPDSTMSVASSSPSEESVALQTTPVETNSAVETPSAAPTLNADHPPPANSPTWPEMGGALRVAQDEPVLGPDQSPKRPTIRSATDDSSPESEFSIAQAGSPAENGPRPFLHVRVEPSDFAERRQDESSGNEDPIISEQQLYTSGSDPRDSTVQPPAAHNKAINSRGKCGNSSNPKAANGPHGPERRSVLAPSARRFSVNVANGRRETSDGKGAKGSLSSKPVGVAAITRRDAEAAAVAQRPQRPVKTRNVSSGSAIPNREKEKSATRPPALQTRGMGPKRGSLDHGNSVEGPTPLRRVSHSGDGAKTGRKLWDQREKNGILTTKIFCDPQLGKTQKASNPVGLSKATTTATATGTAAHPR